MTDKSFRMGNDLLIFQQYCIKELQNCVWKIQNKQKATMKLKVLFWVWLFWHQASESGDTMFSSRTFWFAVWESSGWLTFSPCRKRPYKWLCHTTEPYAAYHESLWRVACELTHTLLHVLTGSLCVHACPNVSRGFIHAYLNEPALKVSPPHMHSTYHMLAGSASPPPVI